MYHTDFRLNARDKHGTVTASHGTCTKVKGNSTVFNCTLNAPQGTVVTLNNVSTQGQGYSVFQTVPANCAVITGVSFPPPP